MVVVTENKALRHIPARTGPLVLDGSGRSLTSGIKNQEMHVFWVKRVFIMYSTKLKQKSQNCVKAAIAFVCTTCKRQLLFALLQLITFVCTTAIDNILSTTPIVNFCMPYCNCQNFYGTTTFVWTIATITINITLLQLLTFNAQW